MAGSQYSYVKTVALEAHAAQEDGLGVAISGTESSHFIALSAAPAAGGKVAYVTAKTAAAAGDMLECADVKIGDLVQLRADAAIAHGALVMVQANGRFITATSTNTAQFQALGAAEQGSVFTALRIEAEVIA